MMLYKKIIVGIVLLLSFQNAHAYILPDNTYVPNLNSFYSTGLNKIDKETTLGNILTWDIVDMFPRMKEYRVEIVDGISNGVVGLVAFGSKTIKIKKQTNRAMDKTLNHEIQHIIEYESGIRYVLSDDEHDTLPIERLPTVNESLYDTERFGIDWLEKQIRIFSIPNTDKAKLKLGYLKQAKEYYLTLQK